MIAIVGYGKMGRYYDKLVNAKFLVDPFYRTFDKVCFSTVQEFLFFHPQVDLVIVTAPTEFHYEICRQLLENSYNVFVEKPITLDFSQAVFLQELAFQKGLLLVQSTLERYNVMIKFLCDYFSKQRVRKCYIKCYRYGYYLLDDRDACFDLAIHDVDLKFYFERTFPDCSFSWDFFYGYTDTPERRWEVFFEDGKVLELDLLRKYVYIRTTEIFLNFDIIIQNNQMLEIINDIFLYGRQMNEDWAQEILFLEHLKRKEVDRNDYNNK